MSEETDKSCKDFFCECPPDSVRVSIEIVSTCESCRGLASVHMFDIEKDKAAAVVSDLVEFMSKKGFPPKTFLIKDIPQKFGEMLCGHEEE